MQSQVKEFLKNLQIEKKREEYIKGAMSYKDKGMSKIYKTIDLTEYSYYIGCDVSPDICPLFWNELSSSNSNKNRRYCTICNKDIYKVNTKLLINKFLLEQKCIAISKAFLYEINCSIDEEKYECLEDRLIISRVFIFYKKYYRGVWGEIKFHNLSYENKLKIILDDIMNEDYKIKICLKKDLDKRFILKLFLKYLKNEYLKQMILDKIESDKFKGYSHDYQ